MPLEPVTMPPDLALDLAPHRLRVVPGRHVLPVRREHARARGGDDVLGPVPVQVAHPLAPQAVHERRRPPREGRRDAQAREDGRLTAAGGDGERREGEPGRVDGGPAVLAVGPDGELGGPGGCEEAGVVSAASVKWFDCEEREGKGGGSGIPFVSRLDILGQHGPDGRSTHFLVGRAQIKGVSNLTIILCRLDR